MPAIPWQQTIGIFEMMIKGLIIGVIVSAPMGPTGVLCVQRTLNKGRQYGFYTGLGAALSDIIYAVITGYGMSLVVRFIENPVYLSWIKMIGSLLLLIFGIFTFRSNPAQSLKPVSHNKGTLIHNFVTGFFITFSNPAIVFLFIALFGQFIFIVPDNIVPQIVGYLCIIVGAVGWWFGLTYLIDKLRHKFEIRGIRIINRSIGCIVIIASLLILFHSLGEWLTYGLPQLRQLSIK